MAWEMISKEEVALLAGIKQSDLRDIWYNMATGIVGRIAGIWNVGAPTSITEVRDGRDLPRIDVHQPPISAVTSVTVDGYSVDSAYISYDTTSIVLSDSGYTGNPYADDQVITEGDKNVTLVYTSGTSTIDYSVALVVALIIKELANLHTMEGSEAVIQFYRPGQSAATEDPLIRWGIHGKIEGIIETFLGKKFRVA